MKSDLHGNLCACIMDLNVNVGNYFLSTQWPVCLIFRIICFFVTFSKFLLQNSASKFLEKYSSTCGLVDKDVVAFYWEVFLIKIHWQLFDKFLFSSSVKCIITRITMNAVIKKYHAFNSHNLKLLFHRQMSLCACMCKSQFSLGFECN